jgi:hypothetical protein
MDLLNQGVFANFLVFTPETKNIMARPIESQLYQELIGSCFNFIERGIKEINEIYESVQHEYGFAPARMETYCKECYSEVQKKK